MDHRYYSSISDRQNDNGGKMMARKKVKTDEDYFKHEVEMLVDSIKRLVQQLKEGGDEAV